MAETWPVKGMFRNGVGTMAANEGGIEAEFSHQVWLAQNGQIPSSSQSGCRLGSANLIEVLATHRYTETMPTKPLDPDEA